MTELKDSIKVNAPAGVVFRWLYKKHEDTIEATRRHIKEEGENLKKALENEL